jgi:hypothetical protein
MHAASGAQSIAVMVARNCGPRIEMWRSSGLGAIHAGNQTEIPAQEMIWPVKQKSLLTREKSGE